MAMSFQETGQREAVKNGVKRSGQLIAIAETQGLKAGNLNGAIKRHEDRNGIQPYRLTDENSVLQFLPHSGAGDSINQTNTNVQNATTAATPDTTIVTSSLSACLSHLRICALR